MTIEQRINKLKAEQLALNKSHDEMVRQNDQVNMEFRKQAGENQARFQQIAGAIVELEDMQAEQRKLVDDELKKEKK